MMAAITFVIGWIWLLRLELALFVFVAAWLLRRIAMPSRMWQVLSPTLAALCGAPLLSGILFAEPVGYGGQLFTWRSWGGAQALDVHFAHYPFHLILAALLFFHVTEFALGRCLASRNALIFIAVMAHIASAVWAMLIAR